MANIIGIIGGMSPVATGEYYQIINQLVKEYKGGHYSAELLINSVDFAIIERSVRTSKWEEAALYLSQKA
ncbi:MAG: aspartate racemase, partial [Bacteroidota bacterium]